jgi:NADH-quinone oxidoreductase subunit D
MYPPISAGIKLSDDIINMSSLNVIAGELDA